MYHTVYTVLEMYHTVYIQC